MRSGDWVVTAGTPVLFEDVDRACCDEEDGERRECGFEHHQQLCPAAERSGRSRKRDDAENECSYRLLHDCLTYSRQRRRTRSTKPPSEQDYSFTLARAEAGQRQECELRLPEREHRGFQLEAAVPADRGMLELCGLRLSEQVDVVERVVHAERAELTHRDLGGEHVALFDRAGEAAVRGALRRQEHMFARSGSARGRA